MISESEEEFIRRWSGRAFDEAQLAQIKEIEAHIIRYAMEGWRPMAVSPPRDRWLICACDDGLQLMRLSKLGDWRTNTGQPHKQPLAWMPAPYMPGESPPEDEDDL